MAVKKQRSQHSFQAAPSPKYITGWQAGTIFATMLGNPGEVEELDGGEAVFFGALVARVQSMVVR